MDAELNEIASRDFFTKVNFVDYKGHVVLDTYERIADAIENFEVRDDDVWVCSFPRSGTTWAQEMVWNIANRSNSRGAEITMEERFPYLEAPGILPLWTQLFEATTAMQHIRNITNSSSPRFIKTHLPYQLLPRQLREREKNCKIIYVSRNPKDACISYYHLYKSSVGYRGSFENFCKLYLGDKVLYAPYWTNANSYLKRHDDNILRIKFEDMKNDLRSIIRQVAAFLGKTSDEEQVKNLEDHLSFTRMKNNPAVNHEAAYAKVNAIKPFGECHEVEQSFIRSGQVGQWKSMMSGELIKQFDDWIDENSK